MHLTRWLIVGGLIGLPILGLVGSIVAQETWERLSSRPLDMTPVRQRIGFQIPEPVLAIVKRDGFAFRAHAALAVLIERTQGASAAAGVQWVKAAAHGRTDGDLERVTRGLKTARLRSDDSLTLQATLCAYVENGHWSSMQRQAFDGAGLQCPLPPRR